MVNLLLYDTGDSRGENNEPLGIEVIGGRILQEFGTNVNLILRWLNCDGLPSDSDLNAQIIGISLNIKQLDVFDKIYQKIKFANNNALIFVGNVVATYGYEYLLKRYKDIICIIGEGEEIYIQIIKNFLENDLKMDRINNIAFWKEGICTTNRKTADLKYYVKPIRVFNNYILNYKGIARIEGSRGCSWRRCDFCCVNYKYNLFSWRKIEIEKIIEQIEELALHGIKSIYFTDEDFIGSDISHLKKLIDGIKKLKKTYITFKDVNFFISIKPIDILRKDVFELLKEFISVGLREIFIGIESGCESQLRRYNKCTTKRINGEALERAKELNADIDIGFILFDPEITVEELQENINFAEKYEIYNYGSNFIKKLRIQSFTEYERKTDARNRLKFDLNNLEYIYDFEDKNVQKIYDLYSQLKWDDYAYKLQKVYRGEIESEKARLKLKKQLVSLRKKQFEYLKKLFQEITNVEI